MEDCGWGDGGGWRGGAQRMRGAGHRQGTRAPPNVPKRSRGARGEQCARWRGVQGRARIHVFEGARECARARRAAYAQLIHRRPAQELESDRAFSAIIILFWV